MFFLTDGHIVVRKVGSIPNPAGVLWVGIILSGNSEIESNRGRKKFILVSLQYFKIGGQIETSNEHTRAFIRKNSNSTTTRFVFTRSQKDKKELLKFFFSKTTTPIDYLHTKMDPSRLRQCTTHHCLSFRGTWSWKLKKKFACFCFIYKIIFYFSNNYSTKRNAMKLKFEWCIRKFEFNDDDVKEWNLLLKTVSVKKCFNEKCFLILTKFLQTIQSR